MTTTVTCDACGNEVERHDFSNVPALGWTVPYDTLGYYYGFTDNLDELEHETTRTFSMCHDCVVRFLETFPLLKRFIQKGSHPSSDEDKPCCDFAWKIQNDRPVLADGGKWLEPGVQ